MLCSPLAGDPMEAHYSMLATFTSIPRRIGLGNSYFVPMSIGNRYYSRSRMRRIANLSLVNADGSVVVPCDRLRVLSYVTHKGVGVDQAKQKAKDECDGMMKMLDNLGISNMSNCHVIPMSVFYGDPALQLFIDALEGAILTEPGASDRLEWLTDYYLDQFYDATDRHEQSRIIQRTNVLHAAGFGIFVTEKLEYRKEIYKDGSGLLQTYLYREHAELLRKLLEKSQLEREFIELMPLLS